MSYYVYILLCSNHTLYTGITTNLKRRFKEHQSGKGCRYTSYNKPIKIIYHEKHKNRSEAAKREYQIKRLSKAQKLDLMKNK